MSFYDEKMIDQAYPAGLLRLCRDGHGGQEFKGGKILRSTPVWGSFPMTACCRAPLLPTMPGRPRGGLEYTPELPGRGENALPLPRWGGHPGLPSAGDLRRAWGGVVDFFTVPEALKRKGDQKAYRRYLRNSLKGRLG